MKSKRSKMFVVVIALVISTLACNNPFDGLGEPRIGEVSTDDKTPEGDASEGSEVDPTVEELQQELEEARTRIDQLSSDLADATVAQSDLDALNDQLSVLQDALDQAEADAAQVSELQQQINDLTAQLDSLQAELEASQAETEAAETAVAEAAEELEALQAEIALAEAEGFLCPSEGAELEPLGAFNVRIPEAGDIVGQLSWGEEVVATGNCRHVELQHLGINEWWIEIVVEIAEQMVTAFVHQDAFESTRSTPLPQPSTGSGTTGGSDNPLDHHVFTIDSLDAQTVTVQSGQIAAVWYRVVIDGESFPGCSGVWLDPGTYEISAEGRIRVWNAPAQMIAQLRQEWQEAVQAEAGDACTYAWYDR